MFVRVFCVALLWLFWCLGFALHVSVTVVDGLPFSSVYCCFCFGLLGLGLELVCWLVVVVSLLCEWFATNSVALLLVSIYFGLHLFILLGLFVWLIVVYCWFIW